MDTSVGYLRSGVSNPVYNTVRTSDSILERWFLKTHLSALILTILPGWIISAITSNTVVADIAALWGTFVGLGWLWVRFGNPLEMLRLARISAAALCIIVNSSWLMSSYIHRFSMNIDIETSLAVSMNGGLTFMFYSIAVIYTLLFCIFLSIIGSWSYLYKREMLVLRSLSNTINVSTSYLLIVTTLIVLGEFVLISLGIIGQRALVVDGIEKGKLPDWYILFESALVAQSVVNSILIIRIWNLRKRIWDNKSALIILIVSILTILFVNFSKGRRDFVFTIIVHFYWICFFVQARPKVSRLIFFVLVIYPLLNQVILFSNYLRSGVHIDETKSFVENLPDLWWDFQSNSVELDEEKGRTKENLATRPLVVTPLALCMQLPDDEKNFMMGKNILHAAIWTIPGPLFPDKANYPILEDLLYAHVNIGQNDTADSVYLSAYTEFGWLGLIIYPLFIVLLLLGMLTIYSKYGRSKLTMLVIFGMLIKVFILSVGEGAVNEYLVTFRLVLFWVFIDNVLFMFTHKKSIVPRVATQLE